ncbi:coiled-coil domain-containing protein [[Eubacterium] cellulosolvens]
MKSSIRRLLKPRKSHKPEVLELSNLTTWLDKHTNPMLDRFKQETRTILVELDKSISNMKITAKKLASSSSDPETRGQERYIIQFAENILSSLDEIQLPDDLSFDHVQAVYEELTRALKAPNRIRQNKVLRLHSSFKPLVKEFDSEFKKLHKISVKLAQVLKNSEPFAQQIKVILKNSEKAFEILEKPKQMKEEIDKAQTQIKQLNSQLEEVNLQFNKIKGKDDFKKLEKVQGKIQELKIELSKFLDPFNKPLRKLVKSISEGKITLRPESMGTLQDFVKDPSYTVLESNNLTQVSLLLHDVKYLLEEGKITIDKKKEKKVLDTIKVVQDGYLKKIRQEFEHLREKERLLISTSEASKFAENSQKLTLSKRKIENEIVELEQSRTRFDKKISELKTELEEILHIIEEKIQTFLGADISILAK